MNAPNKPNPKREALEAVLRAGQLCSNCCFNVSQRENNTVTARESMREACAQWDKATAAMRNLLND